ncbi:MAG: 6-phosphogluconolactonase [Elusimicrobia bacterium]|nr:6-phosphogluconolactonase [Elusimicrobiota bacterium]
MDLFWTDERCVPSSDPRSNYGAARRLFLDRLAGPRPCSFPIDGSQAPAWGAGDYDRLLRGAAPAGLDLAINGVGSDGHTAGLFPGQAPLREKTRWAVAVKRPDGLRGVTMTLPYLNKARRIWVIALGPRKRAVLEKLAQGGDPAWPVLKLRSPLWLVS